MKWQLLFSKTTKDDLEFITTVNELNRSLTDCIEKKPNAILLQSEKTPEGYWKRKKINFFVIIYKILFSKIFRQWLFQKHDPFYGSKFKAIICRLKNHPNGVFWNSLGDEPDMTCKDCGDDLS
jgi:hypothetical protein